MQSGTVMLHVEKEDRFEVEPTRGTDRVTVGVRGPGYGGVMLSILIPCDKLAELRDAIDAHLAAPKADAA